MKESSGGAARLGWGRLSYRECFCSWKKLTEIKCWLASHGLDFLFVQVISPLSHQWIALKCPAPKLIDLFWKYGTINANKNITIYHQNNTNRTQYTWTSAWWSSVGHTGREVIISVGVCVLWGRRVVFGLQWPGQHGGIFIHGEDHLLLHHWVQQAVQVSATAWVCFRSSVSYNILRHLNGQTKGLNYHLANKIGQSFRPSPAVNGLAGQRLQGRWREKSIVAEGWLL